ncbi:MAG: hypothetical protein WBO30_13245 [Ferruginibacter sp.]
MNSANAETNEDTLFHYRQEGNMLTCEYAGGKIKHGQLLGIVDDVGQIKMCYQQINDLGELKTGICTSTPELLPNGKIRLHEDWQWTCGDRSSGKSIIEEL